MMNLCSSDAIRPCDCLLVGARADVAFPIARRCTGLDRNNPANSDSFVVRILYPNLAAGAKSLARSRVDCNYNADANWSQVPTARARRMTQTRSTETNWTRTEKAN